MKHKQKYMDYLFFLYISEEPVQFEYLFNQDGQKEEANTKLYHQAQSAVEQMKQLNLVTKSMQDGNLFIELTAFGKIITESLADAIVKDMLDGWFDTQLDSHGPQQKPA